MDHAVITIDAGVGVHLEHPSTPQPKSSLSIIVSCKEHLNIRKSKEKKAGSGSKDTNKRKCQNTMPIHKKFTDNNIHIHRAAHRTDNNTDNLLGQQQQIPVNIFNLQQQLPNARK
uniref:OSJNBb0034G17.17 protein n=2 Tax=Oryza TaxID=4527 RepID=Q7X8N8_ORYSJ|nr:OSJNBb0034G17.17 [Oryza sativa Japonica Group]